MDEIERILAKVREEHYLTKAEARQLAAAYVDERQRASIYEAELLRQPAAAPFPPSPLGDYTILGERAGEYGQELLCRCNNCGNEEWRPAVLYLA